ncbi:MAG: fused MFS/spermidine synthase [Thermoanaerobaculia bacterium]
MRASDPVPVAFTPMPRTARTRVVLFALTIFSGAFLLFLVQPTVAKMVLPWFGGSAGVWTVAMLFFQLLLLLGYLYAHGTRNLPRQRFLALHLTLLALSLLVLPLFPGVHWKPTGADDPTFRLLGLLTATVGLPYLLLSTTGPLMQARLHEAGLSGSAAGGGPYRLYALSNLGSMLALLSYPVLVEPHLTTRSQGWLWSAGYVAFALLSGTVLVLTSRDGSASRAVEDASAPAPAPEKAQDSPRPRAGGKRGKTRAEAERAPAAGSTFLPITWLLLSASAVTLLLGVTNHICQDVAAVPFLWILPLTLYLVSFILCFDARGWYQRTWFLALLPVAIGAMGYALIPEKLDQKGIIAVLSAGLFVCCMVCHGELHRLRPDPSKLTGFYLTLSAGGAAGGLFVALLAPRLFAEYDELPLGLLVLGALVLVCLRRDPESRLYRARFRPDWLLAIAALLLFGFLVVYRMVAVRESSRVLARNFYGTLCVRDRAVDSHTIRAMYHGVTNHGEQILDPVLGKSPTTYYSRWSGAGLALTRLLAFDAPPRHVGIIGLGTGTLATYGRAGDRLRFYEINPLVIALARSEFTYLSDGKAALEVIPGDARLSLEREAPQRFDMLVVDAFSGDSIPVHLLTLEAFALYQRHLAPGGLIAVHVSNKFLDLPPVVALAAKNRGLEARFVESPAQAESDIYEASWMLLAQDATFFDDPALQSSALPVVPPASLRTWTDDYSNLFSIIK